MLPYYILRLEIKKARCAMAVWSDRLQDYLTGVSHEIRLCTSTNFYMAQFCFYLISKFYFTTCVCFRMFTDFHELLAVVCNSCSKTARELQKGFLDPPENLCVHFEGGFRKSACSSHAAVEQLCVALMQG